MKMILALSVLVISSSSIAGKLSRMSTFADQTSQELEAINSRVIDFINSVDPSLNDSALKNAYEGAYKRFVENINSLDPNEAYLEAKYIHEYIKGHSTRLDFLGKKDKKRNNLYMNAFFLRMMKEKSQNHLAVREAISAEDPIGHFKSKIDEKLTGIEDARKFWNENNEVPMAREDTEKMVNVSLGGLAKVMFSLTDMVRLEPSSDNKRLVREIGFYLHEKLEDIKSLQFEKTNFADMKSIVMKHSYGFKGAEGLFEEIFAKLREDYYFVDTELNKELDKEFDWLYDQDI